MNSRQNAIAVIIAILLTGCLLGAFGTWLLVQRTRNTVNINDGFNQRDYSIRVFDRLQITSEQEAELAEILEESRKEILDCRNELQNRMDKIRVETNEKIFEILDEDQRILFESQLHGMDPRRRGGGGRRDRGGGGRGPRGR